MGILGRERKYEDFVDVRMNLIVEALRRIYVMHAKNHSWNEMPRSTPDMSKIEHEARYSCLGSRQGKVHTINV